MDADRLPNPADFDGGCQAGPGPTEAPGGLECRLSSVVARHAQQFLAVDVTSTLPQWDDVVDRAAKGEQVGALARLALATIAAPDPNAVLHTSPELGIGRNEKAPS